MLNAIVRAETIVREELRATTPVEDAGGEKQGYMRELIGLILRHATYSGASDLHFQCSSYCGKLAMRYDGVLRDVAFYDPDLHNRICTMLTTDGVLGTPDGDVANTVMREGKVSFGRDTDTARKFADIMDLFGYRLQVGAAANGTKTAVIRVVDSQGATADLDNLDFDPESRAIIDAAISAPDGLIILVGPTGAARQPRSTPAWAKLIPSKTQFKPAKNLLKAFMASGSNTRRLIAPVPMKAKKWASSSRACCGMTPT
jgi:hypothetical protein